MGYAIYLIIVGLLGVSGLVVAKKPDLKPIFDKVAPIQGFIGVGAVITSILWLLQVVGNLGMLIKHAPLYGISMIVALVGMFGTGLLLGAGIMAPFMAKNAQAKEKFDLLHSKLLKFQIPLGFICIVAGVLVVVAVPG